MSKRPLNVGLVGGGKGAFIVHPHQKAIHFDGTRRVVAGALFPDPKIALEEAANWPYPIKGYGSYDEMIAANADAARGPEAGLHPHRHAQLRALRPGDEGHEGGHRGVLRKAALPEPQGSQRPGEDRRASCNVPFGVAHTYLGHWTSRFSRYIVRSGLLGDVRWVDSYYIQGWLATKLEATGQQQASWRVDPKRAGGSGCGGDIGTHALMQLRYVTGLDVTQVSRAAGDLRGRPPARRPLHHLLQAEQRRQSPGARLADLHRPQERPRHRHRRHQGHAALAPGRARSASPSCLPNQPDRVYWRGAVTPGDGFLPKDVPADLMAEPTIPPGHPEAFHDAFARLHRCFEADVRKWKAGEPFNCDGSKYANVEDGWMGIAFIETCVKSSEKKGAWTPMPKEV